MKTDAQLQQDVIAELKWEPSVHATQIGVSVKDGVVTLNGEVSSFLEKWNAERAAQRVSGVKALAVEMNIKLSAFGERTDADIAKSAETALEWMGPPTNKNVKVMVEKGWVTLSGEVDWQYEREGAASGVRYLTGVTGVSNQISIHPTTTTSSVKQEIEAALARRSKVDSKKIAVKIDGTAVTLSGSVDSWSERNAAREAAWGAPGVMSVHDEISISA